MLLKSHFLKSKSGKWNDTKVKKQEYKPQLGEITCSFPDLKPSKK